MKLIDVSLLPAAGMVIAKLVGVFLVISLLGIQWSIQDYTGSIFASQTAVSLDRLQEVSSYSDLFVLIMMSAGIAWVLYRAIYLNTQRIGPKLLAKLVEKNLMSLVAGSFDIFYSATVWTIFSWLTAFTIFLNVLNGKTYAWIALVALLLSITFTILLLRDVYSRIEDGRKHFGQQFVY
jgi:hypothetical protein